MIVRQTHDPDDLKAVLGHPAIWECISSDNAPTPDQFAWGKMANNWRCIAGYVDDKPIAVMAYHTFLDGEKLHIQVLPEHRKQYAREFAEAALLFANGTLYAEVPDTYPNVQRFTESFGFEPIDHYWSGRAKNGEPFMITRYTRAS